jgi:multicomponent Na+:H+ antiporter subunit D
MISSLPPGMVLIIGALLISLLRGRIQQVALLVLPVLSALHLLVLPHGVSLTREAFGLQLTMVHIDGLSLVWGYIFHIAAFVSVLYALHVKDTFQHVSALLYAGAAIGAVFAGDLVTLFVYWELTALTSVFLIWASRNEQSYRAGMRYLIWQVGSGVLLLSGIALHYQATGSIDFMGPFYESKSVLAEFPWRSPGLGPILIFLSFGIKAAFPLLHSWLPDAYPQATPTGTVFLSAFTTKLAIYTLARGFPGVECLIWIGAIMTAFPIFFAVIENDLRRVLSYSLNNQLGFMVVGIGIGTELALNGTAAHAFAHILYKALLFMSMGALLYRTGTAKGSELGGLYKSMPWTTGFCIVGAASISAFPLFSGFVTKSLILTAVAEEHHFYIYVVLLFASAGVLEHSGIKIPYFGFFGHDSGKRVKEAPLNMLIAMGIAAGLCIGIGIYPAPLYAILPFEVDYDAYKATHVITQFQLLIGAAVAVALLKQTGVYPAELRSVNLDIDWVYRRPFKRSPVDNLSPVGRVVAWLGQVRGQIEEKLGLLLRRGATLVRTVAGSRGISQKTASIGGMAVWVAILLTLYLVFYYVSSWS